MEAPGTEKREGALYAENAGSIVPVDGEIKNGNPAYGLGYLRFEKHTPATRNPAHRLARPTCYTPLIWGDHCHERPSWILDPRASAYRAGSDGRNFVRAGTVPYWCGSWGGTGPRQGCRPDSGKPQRRNQSRQ